MAQRGQIYFLQITNLSLVDRAIRNQIRWPMNGLILDGSARNRSVPLNGQAIKALRQAGLRLAFLSNMTAAILEDGLKKAGLEGMFETA
jgi:hypothetical protein